MKSERRKESSIKKFILLAFLSLLLTIACINENSSDHGESSLDKISNDAEVLNIDDFTSIGLRIYKEYDVSELLNAEGAWSGMWKDQGAPIDFEVRVYRSYSDALEYGVSYADDVTGKDAIVKKSESMWSEGLKDRVVLASRLRDWGGVAGQKRVPKYLEYFVYNNIILLCEGLEPAESIIHCSNIINELR